MSGAPGYRAPAAFLTIQLQKLSTVTLKNQASPFQRLNQQWNQLDDQKGRDEYDEHGH